MFPVGILVRVSRSLFLGALFAFLLRRVSVFLFVRPGGRCGPARFLFARFSRWGSMVWPYAVSSICFFGLLFLVLAFWFGRFRHGGDPGFGHMLFYRSVFLHSIPSGRLFCWSISARLGSGDSLFSSRLGPGDPFCARLLPSLFSPLLGSRVGACVLISVGGARFFSRDALVASLPPSPPVFFRCFDSGRLLDRLVASALLKFLVVCYWGISSSLSLDCWCSLSLFQVACCCSFLLQSLLPSGGALSLLRGWFVLRVLLTAFLTRAVPSSSVSVSSVPVLLQDVCCLLFLRSFARAGCNPMPAVLPFLPA